MAAGKPRTNISWSDIGFGGDSVHALQSHAPFHLRDGTRLEYGAHDYLRNVEIEEAVCRSAKENRFMPLQGNHR